MARHKSRQRVSKEHLAYAIRKDYNAAMINEPEIITNFIYTVYNQSLLNSAIVPSTGLLC